MNLQKSLLNRIDSLSTQRFTALLYSRWTDRRLCLRLNVHTIHPKLCVEKYLKSSKNEVEN